MTTKITEEQAEKLGTAWTHPRTGRVRYYINDSTIWGFDYSTYRSGHVSRATLDGEKISNNQAQSLAGLKVWIEDGEVNVSNDLGPKAPIDVDEIKNRVAEAARRM